jgi:hypothetical protein
MPSFYYDLWYLRAGVEQLENYLLADDIYWHLGVQPPSGEPPYPQLTLGWLLLANKRVSLEAETAKQEGKVVQLSKQLESIQSKWRTAWEQKAAKEYHARVILWRDFLEEYRSNPDQNYDRYAYEVSRRVLLELLNHIDSALIAAADLSLLSGLDKMIRSILKTSGFIWDENLQSGFDKERYWYLYGLLPKTI